MNTTQSMKNGNLMAFAVSIAACALLLFACPAMAEEKRPNFIYILADDIGWADLAVTGSTYFETPNLDRLAQSGTRFTDAYTTSPLCSPSRAAFLTGQYPARIGITAPVGHLDRVETKSTLQESAGPGVKVLAAVSATRLATEYTTLPEALRSAGYRTAHFGKWHLGYNRDGHPEDKFEPRDQGLDIDYPHTPNVPGPMSGFLAPWTFIENPKIKGAPSENIEDHMSEEAARFIMTVPKDRPFYMNYWAYSVHYPWQAKPDYIAHFEKKRDTSNPQQNPIYAAMVKTLDDAVGRIVEAVEKAGIADNTVIIFFSDNGGNSTPPMPKYPVNPPQYQSVPITSMEPLRGGKASIYEGGVRLPLIISWPDHVAAGRVSSGMISSLDFYPTVLALAGVQVPKGLKLDGYNQSQLLLGGESARKDMFVHFPHGGQLEAQFIPGMKPSASVREGDWKLVRFFADGPRGADVHELYDLKTDIGEKVDLAASHPYKVADLSRRLDALLADAGAVIPHRNPNFDPTSPPEPNPIEE